MIVVSNQDMKSRTMGYFVPHLKDAFPAKLNSGEVHIHRICLDEIPTEAGTLRILDEDERSRASHIRSTLIRHRFVASHVALREILGHYLKREPEKVRFTRGKHGRPLLADYESTLDFSLSHTTGQALIGVTRDRRVGVDIERIWPGLPAVSLARRYLCPGEARLVEEAGGRLAAEKFVLLWVRKEAYLKALGLGLGKLGSAPDFSRSLSLDVADYKLPNLYGDRVDWKLVDLDVDTEHKAAVILSGRGPIHLKAMSWPSGF